MVWSKPSKVSGGLNSTGDEIANCMSYDGSKMLLHRVEGGQSDIWESKLVGANWTDPKKLPLMISSDKNNEKYASYSDDGWKIFF